MKRDMDLVRKILFEIEKMEYSDNRLEIYPRGGFSSEDEPLHGYQREDISYHLLLLKEASLIQADQLGAFWYPIRLTWEGHEFLDAARDDARWEKAKVAMANAGSFAIDVMKQLLVQYLKTELKLS